MKLFVTDYDDTLYTNDTSIKENIKKLKLLRDNNFYIVISTGRSYPSIKTQINLYQIPYDYLTCADGSIIYDNKGKIIYYECLNNDIVERLEKFYQELDYEEIQFSYPNGYLNTFQEEKDLLGINICISSRLYNNKLVKSFLKIKKQYPNYNYLCYMHSNFSYLCVKPSNISKSYAVKVLKDELNIKKDDIYIIGDSSNDIEMIYDYNGVGMKNSCSDILKIVSKTYNEVSDYIIDILKESH